MVTINQESLTSKSAAERAYEDCELQTTKYLLANEEQQPETEENSYYVDAGLRFGEAPRIVDEILIAATFPKISEEHRNLLEESVALSLQFGLDEQDILETADSFSWSIGDKEQFVKGLLTLISLKTAQSLHWKNMSEGGEGILDDFDVMVETVGDAITGGYITFDHLDLQEKPDIRGIYDADLNKIYFDPSTFDSNGLLLASTLVHESRHAYRDISRVSMTLGREENEGYTANRRFLFLTGNTYYDVGFEIPYEMLPILDEYGEDKKHYIRASNSLFSMLNERSVDLRDSYGAWYENTIMEMYGISTASKKDLFYQWYANRYFTSLDNNFFRVIPEKMKEIMITLLPCKESDGARADEELQQLRHRMYEDCKSSLALDRDKDAACLFRIKNYMEIFNFIFGVHSIRALRCHDENEFVRFFEKNAVLYHSTDTDFITDQILRCLPNSNNGL